MLISSYSQVKQNKTYHTDVAVIFPITVTDETRLSRATKRTQRIVDHLNDTAVRSLRRSERNSSARYSPFSKSYCWYRLFVFPWRISRLFIFLPSGVSTSR